MLGMVILVRILSPSDYGLIAMVMVVLNFVQLFKDAGLATATVQNAQISHDQISALFWVNTLIGALIALVVFLAAPLISVFFKQPELTGITAALSLSILFTGIAVQHEALLRRHLRFLSLAYSQILSLAASQAVAIFLAVIGFRYWALVAGNVMQAVVWVIMIFYFCPWRPGRMKKGTGVRGMLRFGSHLTGFHFANYFARNADNILVGKYVGKAGLGLYSRAYQLLMLPLSQIRAPLDQVALPALSSLRGTPERYAGYFRRMLEVYAHLMTPITLLGALEADFFVRLLLGPQWIGAVAVFRILAIAGLVQAISTTRGLVMVSCGHSRRYLRWGLFNALLMVLSFIAGLPFGIEGVAAAYTIANYIVLFPSLRYCFNDTPVTVGMFLRAFYPPLLAALPGFAVILLAKHFWPGQSLLLHGIYSFVFIASFFFFSWRRRSVRETLGLVLDGLRSERNLNPENGASA